MGQSVTRRYVATNRGQYDEAIAWIGRALALNPHEALFHANLGNTMMEQRRIAQAIESCREALRLRPGGTGVQGNLSRACDKRYVEAIEHDDADRFSQADEGCRPTLEVRPDSADS